MSLLEECVKSAFSAHKSSLSHCYERSGCYFNWASVTYFVSVCPSSSHIYNLV